VKIDRTFAAGDVVKLDLPMNLREETPVANGVCLVRGPLVFALKIQEDRAEVTKGPNIKPGFPAWDIKPASPWNYALAIAGPQDLSKIKVQAGPVTVFPWTPDSAPVVLTAPACRVSGWDVTPDGKNPALPDKVTPAGPVEQVQLIPLGATQIRLSVFPKAE